MMLTFMVSNFNSIALALWVIFFCIVVLRAAKLNLVRNFSFMWLIAIAVFFHLLYGIFATWGQYVVWNQSEVGKVFLSSGLSTSVQFPFILEWARPFFNGAHGYFAFYSFGHFFLSTVALFFITALFVIFFKTYSYYRPESFNEGDIAIITIAFLVAGWLGSIVLVPLAFAVAVLFTLLGLRWGSMPRVGLPESFLIASPLAFLYSVPILKYCNLYLLLKL